MKIKNKIDKCKKFINNSYFHLKTVCIHKHWVGVYCRLFGLYDRAILHDLSKFSPVEFFESVKYYQGTSSPIDACKKENGWSKAWQHHKGRNKHHYEYWIDNFDNGGVPIRMPYKYAVEMLCDYLGAGKAYMGKDFSYVKEYEWWENKSRKNMLIHPAIKDFIESSLKVLALYEQKTPQIEQDYSWFFDKKYIRKLYHRSYKRFCDDILNRLENI